MRVLLVEDNEDDVFAFRYALKGAGLSVELNVVTDGQQAVDYLAGEGKFADRELPSLLFLDLKLPYVSGHEILEWMRERKELDSISVIVLSGSDESRDHARVEEKGVDRYLVKPPSPEDLLGVLDPSHSGK
jgi:DNA-binding response OmpR family regulator